MTDDIDMLEALFGDREWMLPDEPPWDGDFLDATALVARLRAQLATESAVLDVAAADAKEAWADVARFRERADIFEARLAEVTRERDEARDSLVRRVFRLGSKVRDGRASVDAVHAGVITRAYSPAEIARAWGWGYPEGTDAP